VIGGRSSPFRRYSMSRKRRVAPIADDLDIGVSCSSSALTRRKPPSSQKGKAPFITHNDGTDDDTELEEMIRNSISKRNVKDGTELLKNTKGKKKLSKGEIGGGSFQSMGKPSSLSASHDLILLFCLRTFSMDFTLPETTGFANTHSNPTTFHPSSSF
jgi:hypothetical protein